MDKKKKSAHEKNEGKGDEGQESKTDSFGETGSHHTSESQEETNEKIAFSDVEQNPKEAASAVIGAEGVSDIKEGSKLKRSAKNEIDHSHIDINAIWVVRRLRAKGFEAYLTGGCVRDLLLGKVPKDFDVATSARPEEVKKLFRNCRLVGRRFLLAHVFFPGGKVIETATFRTNPVDVQDDLPEDLLVTQDNVYGSIEDDAKRRDLTINGLFYDPVDGRVIDYVGARKDLESKIIKAIGDPDIRFREDPVRILRAIKFATRLDFSIEKETLAGMKAHASELVRCAPARVQEELVRLLSSGKAREALKMCEDAGILDVLLPELVEGLSIDLPKIEGLEPEKRVSSPEERRESLVEVLRAVDEIVGRDCEISPAVAFASILMPVYAAFEMSAQNERNWIDKLCISWAERIRITRKDQDRIRLLLSAVQMMSAEEINKKSAQYLVGKSWFRESLLLYIASLMAKKKSLDSVNMWKEWADEVKKPYRQEKHSLKKLGVRFRRRRPSIRPRGQRSIKTARGRQLG